MGCGIFARSKSPRRPTPSGDKQALQGLEAERGNSMPNPERGGTDRKVPDPEAQKNNWVQLLVDKVVINSKEEEQFIFLREAGGQVVFPIAVGLYEAASVKQLLEEAVTPRPLTHELIFQVVRALGGSILCVVIEDLLGGVFYARLVLRTKEGQRREVDCRPSDAVCVALDAGVPIYAPRRLLDRISTG